MQYRREIDGLRALAVLPVILFHAGFSWISGGFVGVDVFFVISGYLITTIVLTDLSEGRFSIADFYERRARRILPALFLVLGCSVPLALWMLLPDQLLGFSKSLASVMLFLSNVYFRGELDYFARTAEEEPLLHTWSLAVEEQYYLVFPLLALLLWKKQSRLFLISIVTVAVVSFIYAENQSLSQPDKAFFDTRTRLWELLIGSILAVYRLRVQRAQPSKTLAEVGGALGLILIVWACLTFDKSTPFPGRYALAPTVGAALIILYATPKTWAGRFLGWKPAVGVGLISYSAYLWHQPIFAFARVASPQPPSETMFAALAVLTLLLAYLTWRWVEQPFRKKSRYGRRQIFLFSIIGGFVFFVVALIGSKLDGLPSRFSSNDSDLMVPFEERGNYVGSLHKSYGNPDPFADNGEHKILIIGDSFSQDLVNALSEANVLRGKQVRTRYIPARCQLYQGDEPLVNLVQPRDVKLCSGDYYQGLKELVDQSDGVLVAFSWREWSAERLPITLDRLGIAAKENYIVFGRKRLGHINRSSFLRKSDGVKSAYLNPIPESNKIINSLLREKLSPYHFVDVQSLICGDVENVCRLFDGNGQLISHDGSHLTKSGAAYLGARLLEDVTFKVFLQSIESKF